MHYQRGCTVTSKGNDMLTFDFSGIYENEGFDFCKENSPRSLFAHRMISLKDITGTNCICDEYAQTEIKTRILSLGSDDRSGYLLRFFDSGNYHYMSKLLMDLTCEHPEYFGKSATGDFDLILFDHHPDMKWTSYGEILSCGSWVLNALKDRPELKNVYIIGADAGLAEEVRDDNPQCMDRVSFYGRIGEVPLEKINGAIYISVDKDVIRESEIATNWDQGFKSTKELMDELTFLGKAFCKKIVAVDVCGECQIDSEELFSERGIKASNSINKMIIEIFEKYF